ncbi:MAG TPA: histidine kinase [Candidatus Limnocylindrales bacterium]|nr:histidine kinase [Candidatus Limnocylindrales bacterium]
MGGRRTAAALTESDATLGRLLAVVPHAMAMVSDAETFCFVNAAWETLFAYPHDELLGSPVSSILGGLPATAAASPVLFSHAPLRSRAGLIGRRKDGAWLAIDVTALSIDTRSPSMRVLFAQDTAERWQAEDQVQAAAELNRKRISDQIHDESIQSITAASLRLQQLRQGAREPSELRVLTAIEDLLESTNMELRRLMTRLHPPGLDGLGLRNPIREILEVTLLDHGVSVQVFDHLPQEPSGPRRITLYRIAELMLRAACAAHPRHLVVEIGLRNHGLLLTIDHDGTAGAVEDVTTAGDRDTIASLVRLAGGSVSFERTAAGGARASIWITGGAEFHGPGDLGRTAGTAAT